MTRPSLGGHQISVTRYIGKLKEQESKREEARWLPLDETRIASDSNTETEALRGIAHSFLQQLPIQTLNERERAVLGKLVDGSQNVEVAQELGLSEATVSQVKQKAILKIRNSSIGLELYGLLHEIFNE